MIAIVRPTKPSFLEHELIQFLMHDAEQFYSQENRAQRRYDWKYVSKIDDDLKRNFIELFHYKCCYCEGPILNPNEGEINRYRPYDGVQDPNTFYADQYWWLVYDWNNLLFACKDCHQFKANYFPIKGKRVIISGKSDLPYTKLTLSDQAYNVEEPLLLNPCIDHPNEHLGYGESTIIGLTPRGQLTIELLRLNRESLVNARLQAKVELTASLRNLSSTHKEKASEAMKYLRGLYLEEDKSIPLLGYKKHLLKEALPDDPNLWQDWVFEAPKKNDVVTPKTLSPDHRTDLNDIISKASRDDMIIDMSYDIKETDIIDYLSSKTKVVTNDYFPIEYIEIKNFKSISNLTIPFKADELDKRSWLFLLGENGVGKSSILQAIALGLHYDPTLITTELAKKLLKKGKRVCKIKIKERNSSNTMTTTINAKGVVTQTGNFNGHLIGYGSLRLSDDRKKHSIAAISYENLFLPTKPLNDVIDWLTTVKKKNRDLFDRVAIALKTLLPQQDANIDISMYRGKLVVGPDKISFEDLSDGYRSTITFVLDIIMKLSNIAADMNKMAGIVLVDELGNQLHPRWQMRIVQQLRRIFPNITFIVSTHHPLCLRGAKDEEILLIKLVDQNVVVTDKLPDPSILRVDQILASEFFGLNSLLDPEIEATFNKYYALLAKKDSMTDEENSELMRLRDHLKDKKQLGSTLREELMYTVIDTLLADQVVYNKNSISRLELKEMVLDRVKEVWSKVNRESYD